MDVFQEKEWLSRMFNALAKRTKLGNGWALVEVQARDS